MRILILLGLLALAMFAPPAAPPVFAQEQANEQAVEKSHPLMPRRKGEASFFREPVQWLRERQQQIYSAMNAAMNALKRDPWGPAFWTLLGLGFFYGVLHAAGPGHGKAVISAWLIATENELKRGVFIAFLSALIQALVAIGLVGGLYVLFGAAATASARDISGVLESMSYALIAAMGLYLVYTALRGLIPVAAPAPVLAVAGHGHHHSHDHSHQHHHHHAHAPAHHDHHGHDHDAACCGHAHAPSPVDVRGAWSLRRSIAIAASVGLRPCLGAVLMLIFALPAGVFAAATLSVFAMAFGTFLTVSAIAALSVYGKALAMRIASRDGRRAQQLGMALRLGGGMVVALFGVLLFWASLGQPTGMS